MPHPLYLCRSVLKLCIVVLMLTGLLAAQSIEFEVASIKPNNSGSPRSGTSMPPAGRFEGTNVTLVQLLERAFAIRESQIIGGPNWIRSDRFDVIGKTSDSTPPNRMPDMLRALLLDRFKLVAHHESREESIYELRLARGDGKPGPGLVAVDCEARGSGYCGNTSTDERSGLGTIKGAGVTMKELADWASNRVDRLVVDRTGLSGNYDLEMRYTSARPDAVVPADVPSLFTVMQEQLGLKLEGARGPVEVLVIDSVQRPTPD